MVSAGTPIIYALLGDLIGQRTGITSLIVEGSMLCGACVGFAVAAGSGQDGSQRQEHVQMNLNRD